LVVEATLKDLLLVAHLVLEVSAARQPAPEALEAVAVVSKAVSAGEVVVAAVLVEIAPDLVAAVVEADSVVEVEEEEEEALVVDEAALGTSLMAMVPPTALPLDLEAQERAASVAGVVVALVEIVDLAAAGTGTIDEVVVVVADMIEAQAVPTMNRLAAEIDHAMAVETVGMVETIAHGNVGTKATVTTIRDSEGGTEPFQWFEYASARVCQGYLPFFRLIISRQ
jgi:hypothetical protein